MFKACLCVCVYLFAHCNVLSQIMMITMVLFVRSWAWVNGRSVSVIILNCFPHSSLDPVRSLHKTQASSNWCRQDGGCRCEAQGEKKGRMWDILVLQLLREKTHHRKNSSEKKGRREKKGSDVGYSRLATPQLNFGCNPTGWLKSVAFFKTTRSSLVFYPRPARKLLHLDQ